MTGTQQKTAVEPGGLTELLRGLARTPEIFLESTCGTVQHYCSKAHLASCGPAVKEIGKAAVAWEPLEMEVQTGIALSRSHKETGIALSRSPGSFPQRL